MSEGIKSGQAAADTPGMKYVPALFLALTLGLTSSSCATGHSVRYAYGEESFFAEAIDPHEDQDHATRVARAIFGVPVFLGSVGFDVLTFPAQAIFGVWPWWGAKSLSMQPDVDE